MVQQPAHILRGQVGLQRPRGVDVAEGRHEVRDVGIGEAPVGPGPGEVDSISVDHEVHLAEGDQVQAGGSNDQVGLEFLAGLEPDSRLSERVDVVGDHRCISRPDRPVEVAIREQAQALVPGVIGRREVGVDVIVGAESLPDPVQQQFLHLLRIGSGLAVDESLAEHVLLAGEGVGQPGWKEASQLIGDGVLGWPGHHVGGGPLNHRHVGRGVGDGRDESHGCCAGADHHYPLSGVVEVVGPLLGVDDPPSKSVPAWELRGVALPVAVVAGAHEQEPTRHGDYLVRVSARTGADGGKGPTRVAAGPFGP